MEKKSAIIIKTDLGMGEQMKNTNICKFPAQAYSGGTISVSKFVKETDRGVMCSRMILDSHRMMLVSEGDGCFLINGEKYHVGKGALMIIFEGEEISLLDGDLTYMYVDYSNMRADELHRRFNISPLTRLMNGFDGLIPLWQESLARASEKTIDLATESILLYTFSRLSDLAPEKNEIMAKIAQITEQCFGDPNLNLADIAQRLNYHPKYLSHMFKEKMGISYSEYLRSVRLKYAITLLDHGLDSVKNVALLSGFSDPLYFSKVFKDSVGVSPMGYVKNKRLEK